jgi:hypothetical protein
VHRYALASFLLGTDGTQYFFFSPNGNDDGVNAPDTPDDHAKPGTPLGGYTALANGAFMRRFSAGVAAVNPGTATVTINLGGSYVDLDGHTVQQATLAPHSGMVFTTTTSTSSTSTTTPSTTTSTTSTTLARTRSKTSTASPPTTSTTSPRATSTTVTTAPTTACGTVRRCTPRPAP